MECRKCERGNGEHTEACAVGRYESLIGPLMDTNNYPSYQYRPITQMSERERARVYARTIATQLLKAINAAP